MATPDGCPACDALNKSCDPEAIYVAAATAGVMAVAGFTTAQEVEARIRGLFCGRHATLILRAVITMMAFGEGGKKKKRIQ